ncbi:MAG: VWA domain-containing protein [Dehalococcoidia bacterium]|nr:VWA domain-containing protein [Dehalococcoidia bacterium]
MKTLLMIGVLLTVLAMMVGCGGSDCTGVSGGGTPTPPPPPPPGGFVSATDPAIPPVVAGDFIMSGGVAALAADHAKKKITLSSVLLAGVPLDLVKGDFQVIEGTTPLTVFDVKPLASTSSKADIAFAVDATGSMGGAIDGVKSSIIAFADSLTAGGIDVRFAGVDFYDKVGHDVGETPPPDLGIFGKNLDKTTAQFQAFIGSLVATGGGDGPEVSVDAIKELADRVNWRADAQSIIVGITDIVSHQRDDGTTFALWTADEAIAACLGRIVVHTFSPGGSSSSVAAAIGNDGLPYVPGASPSATTTVIDIAGIATATGGRAFPFSGGSIDLTAIPLGSTISKGYVITFDDPIVGVPHKVKVVINKGGKTASIEFSLLF